MNDEGFFYSTIYYHDIIESIIAALEAKDAYTANHSCRVADMALVIARTLGMNDRECEEIHMAGHVHDIGKIGVPDYILNKSGCLTKEEWQIMKKHPDIGANILSKSEHLKDIAYVVRCHHERVDGTGYPLGLKAIQIPIGAKIIAICDSIDAMKSKRAYRLPLSDEVCKIEISKNIDKMYDKVIATLILEHWNKIVINY